MCQSSHTDLICSKQERFGTTLIDAKPKCINAGKVINPKNLEKLGKEARHS
jgi:hypothetical protein